MADFTFDCVFDLALGKRILSVNLQTHTQVVGIFGASGAGKSSILHAVAGLSRPKTGHIIFCGDRWFDGQKNINLSTQKRRVGLVFQDAQIFPHKSVKDNLLFGYNRIHANERKFTFDEIVHLLKLEHLVERMPTKLSGGEKQRVCLGRALLYSPNLLLMDEPLSALDSTHKAEILPFFEQIIADFNIPMLYVSHDRAEIERITDTIYSV